MIARLSGILAEATGDTAVIDVSGVGYLVHLSGRTLDALGPVGGQVLVLTELQVREDACNRSTPLIRVRRTRMHLSDVYEAQGDLLRQVADLSSRSRTAARR